MNDFVFEGKELYRDDRVLICKSTQGEGHDMLINHNYISLPRGTLQEMATSNPDNIERMYNNIISPVTGLSLDDLEISPTELGWDMAKAKNKELLECLFSKY
jgi:hypothetical protein